MGDVEEDQYLDVLPSHLEVIKGKPTQSGQVLKVAHLIDEKAGIENAIKVAQAVLKQKHPTSDRRKMVDVFIKAVFKELPAKFFPDSFDKQSFTKKVSLLPSLANLSADEERDLASFITASQTPGHPKPLTSSSLEKALKDKPEKYLFSDIFLQTVPEITSTSVLDSAQLTSTLAEMYDDTPTDSDQIMRTLGLEPMEKIAPQKSTKVDHPEFFTLKMPTEKRKYSTSNAQTNLFLSKSEQVLPESDVLLKLKPVSKIAIVEQETLPLDQCLDDFSKHLKQEVYSEIPTVEKLTLFSGESPHISSGATSSIKGKKQSVNSQGVCNEVPEPEENIEQTKQISTKTEPKAVQNEKISGKKSEKLIKNVEDDKVDDQITPDERELTKKISKEVNDLITPNRKIMVPQGLKNEPQKKVEDTMPEKNLAQKPILVKPKKKGEIGTKDNQEKSAGKLPDIPKLKKTKPDSTSESPLEKLKRLEDEKPTEIVYSDEEIIVSELPEYSLPTRREKTMLENYEALPQETQPKLVNPKEAPDAKWDKLKKKNSEPENNTKIVLGKGKTAGAKKILVFLTVAIVFII
jgi:hypothetical protein